MMSRRHCRRQRGLALVAVMWMIIALGVLVSGLVSVARSEIRHLGDQRDALQALAQGNGAINHVLARRVNAREGQALLQRVDVAFEERSISVTVVPLHGLVDLNSAPAPLLVELIVVAGGVERDDAVRLAERIVDFRDPDRVTGAGAVEEVAYRDSGHAPRNSPFVLVQDLLQVAGVSLDLYVRLAPLVTADLAGDGLVNPLSAPLPVLEVLAGGNASVAAAYRQARASDGSRADTTRFRPGLTGKGVSRRARLEALVPLADGGFMRVMRVADLSQHSAGGAPWRTLARQSTFVRNPAR